MTFSLKQIPVTRIGLNDVMFNSQVRRIAAWLSQTQDGRWRTKRDPRPQIVVLLK